MMRNVAASAAAPVLWIWLTGRDGRSSTVHLESHESIQLAFQRSADERLTKIIR